jgi:hypothetical protein
MDDDPRSAVVNRALVHSVDVDVEEVKDRLA